MKVDFKKAFSKKKIAAVIVILLAILIMVLSNPDIKTFFTDTGSVKLSFETGVDYDALTYGKDMLLVNNEGIYAIDKSGREAWNAISAATNPAVQVKGDYIILFDMNGKSVKTFRKEKTVAQIQTENEILCAKVNNNGYVAVATDELGYKGLVTLYDNDGDEVFKWHSGTGYIGDIDISSKNKIAVSQIVTNKEQVKTRIVIIDPKSEDEPECIAELDGIVMKLSYREGQKLVAVSGKGLYGFKNNGKPYFAVNFEGRTPLSCNIENENNMVIAFDSGLNNTILESYSASGKLRGSYNSAHEIKAYDVSGECILAVSIDGVVRLNPKGNVKKEMKLSKDVQEIRIFSGRDRFLSLGGSSAEIIKF